MKISIGQGRVRDPKPSSGCRFDQISQKQAVAISATAGIAGVLSPDGNPDQRATALA